MRAECFFILIQERRALISAFMESVRHNLTRSNIRDIADATANRTRGQIEAICRKAASIPALEVPNELIRTAIPSSVSKIYIEPLNPSLYFNVTNVCIADSPCYHRGFHHSPKSETLSEFSRTDWWLQLNGNFINGKWSFSRIFWRRGTLSSWSQ